MESISSTFFVCLFLYKSLFPSYVLALNELFFTKNVCYMVFSKIHGIFKKFDQEMAKIIHFCTLFDSIESI